MMRFRRSAPHYGRTEPAETPYIRAGRVWDERLGSARAQAFNWRLAALGQLLLSTGLVGLVAWQSQQSRVVPYVIEVDRLGEPRAIAPADRMHAPNEAEIAWQLSRYVRDVRSVSLDPVVTRDNWLDAYALSTEQGAHFLSAQARSNDPFADPGVKATTVAITSVVRISEQSYQVKWSEAHYERAALTDRSHWTGILTLKSIAPRSTEALKANPLGIYVDGVDWSREWSGEDHPPADHPQETDHQQETAS